MTNCLQTLYLEISKIHLNIRSLNKNCSELYHFLHLLDHDFDVVVLSEMWSYNISFYRNLLPNYTLFFDLPVVGNVGGVGIYIKNSITHKPVSYTHLTLPTTPYV